MTRTHVVARFKFVSLLLVAASVAAACATAGQKGAVGGAGIGALAGGLIGGSTQAALIGTAVGTGVGYIIGNEVDKKHAAELSSQTSSSAPVHSEVGKLSGTRWKLVSLNPPDAAPPYKAKVLEFRPNGRVTTMTTMPNGVMAMADETYRVVGDTLIINKPGYLINAKFQMTETQLVVSADKFSAVLERLPGQV